jgi:hypothetical protein
MTANVPNPGSYLSAIGNDLTNLRDVLRSLVDKNSYILSNGGIAFLEAPVPNGLGMSAPDATALIATLGNMANLSAYANGAVATQTLNFIANGEPFWGG